MSDETIFFPSERLRDLFKGLREDFTNQIEKLLEGPVANDPDVPNVTREAFMEGFQTHIHRYQQMFLILRDIGLLKNSMLEVNFLSAITTPDYDGGRLLPVIRQYDDYMYVGFEEPPMDIGPTDKQDTITVATVPLLPEDDRPYQGRSVIVTTVDEETEMTLITHDRTNDTVILMWGDYVMEQAKVKESDPKMLN